MLPVAAISPTQAPMAELQLRSMRLLSNGSGQDLPQLVQVSSAIPTAAMGGYEQRLLARLPSLWQQQIEPMLAPWAQQWCAAMASLHQQSLGHGLLGKLGAASAIRKQLERTLAPHCQQLALAIQALYEQLQAHDMRANLSQLQCHLLYLLQQKLTHQLAYQTAQAYAQQAALAWHTCHISCSFSWQHNVCLAKWHCGLTPKRSYAV